MSSERHAGPAPDADQRLELRKEAWVMALYVAVCLLAALTAVADNGESGHVRALGIIWGTTFGLALAHVFAFRVSARLVAQGTIRADDRFAIAAQLVGAMAVAVFATVPVLLLPSASEFDTVRWALSLLIAVVGYLVATSSGAGRTRSLVYAGALLVIAIAIALLKNVLGGH